MTVIHNRLSLYLYATETFAEVYEPNHKRVYHIDFNDSRAEEIITFLVDGQDEAQSIVAGSRLGYEIALTSLYDYYNIAEAIADDVDPHDSMPFTVSMSFFAHEHKDFGDFLDSLNFNHEHLDAVCADAVLKTY
jgi:hypothetical protein